MVVERSFSWKEAPVMTGSFLVPIVAPVVAVVAMACWMGMIFWADAHPGWKTRHIAEVTRFPGESSALAGDLAGGELAQPQQEKAA
jgi:hypothetical protein